MIFLNICKLKKKSPLITCLTAYLLCIRQCSKHLICHHRPYQIRGYILLKPHGFLKKLIILHRDSDISLKRTEIIFPGHYFLFSYLVRFSGNWFLICTSCFHILEFSNSVSISGFIEYCHLLWHWGKFNMLIKRCWSGDVKFLLGSWLNITQRILTEKKRW